ncbi:MAG: tagaturonate reductase [Lachnospiraceae bacterium]|nr:tagaturonate reductase [Lachnospiraceae bacterium]
MERLNAAMTGKKDRPIRVVQFGSGNFLRGFVDYMIDIANEKGLFDGDIVLLQPNSVGGTEKFREQDCQYTVSLRGIVDGEAVVMNRQITSVREILGCVGDYERYMALAELDTLKFVVSNTTEAGIVFDPMDQFEAKPAKSFSGKLTQFLYRRYQVFGGAADKGLVMLPAELIDDNGAALKACVDRLIDLWNLEDGFKRWVDEACVFTSTLVDRIVTGYPRDTEQEEWEKLGYEDRIMVTGEPFALWVIESEKDISGELPLDKAMADMPGMDVIYTDDHKPYKKRKVRILNGAHTSFVLASFLCGNDTVLESMKDEDVRGFLEKTLYDEVIPTLDLPKEELIDFAKAVESRFENPYVKHALLSISLNSVSKWRARCMPSLLAFVEERGELPAHLTFSLAALMAFYSGRELRGGKLVGRREVTTSVTEFAHDSAKDKCDYRAGNDCVHHGEAAKQHEEYMISDDASVLAFFAEHSADDTGMFVNACLAREDFWGQDLTKVEGLVEAVTAYLDDIRENGMRAALCRIS